MACMRILAAATLAAILFCGCGHDASSQQAKPPVPTNSFMLQTQGLSRLPSMKWWSMKLVMTPPVTVIAATADRSGLFALIPQEDRRWQLQRLTGWGTGSPRVQSLEFDGDDHDSRFDYVRAGMTPSPDGRYLLVRIFVLDTNQWKRRAVVVMVDLETFRVVWRRVSDDPLVANSHWRFIDAHTLIAVGGPPPTHIGKPVVRLMISQDILRMNPASPGEHEAGVLSLPNLDVSAGCMYSVREADTAAATNTPDRYLEAQGDGCAGLLKIAGVASLARLPGLREIRNLVGHTFGQGCEFEDGDDSIGIALFNCRKGGPRKEADDNFGMDEEEERVAKPVLSGVKILLCVPLKRWEDYSSALVSANGQNYLLLRRDKLKIEMFQVP